MTSPCDQNEYSIIYCLPKTQSWLINLPRAQVRLTEATQIQAEDKSVTWLQRNWGSWHVLAGYSGALWLHLAAASPQAGSEPWPGMTPPYDHSAPKQRLGFLVLALPAGTDQSAVPHLHPTSSLPVTRGIFRWKPSGFTCTRPGTLHETTSPALRQHFRHQVII